MEKQSLIKISPEGLIKINAIAFILILFIQLLKFYSIENHFFSMLFTSIHDITYVLLLIIFVIFVSVCNKMSILDVIIGTLRTSFALIFSKERLNLMQIGMSVLWLISFCLIVAIIINVFPEVLTLSKELSHRLHKTDYSKHRDVIAYTFATAIILIFMGGKLVFDYLIWGNIRTGTPVNIFGWKTTSQRITIFTLFVVFNVAVEAFNAYCFGLNKVAKNVNNGKLADSNGNVKLLSLETPQTKSIEKSISDKAEKQKILLGLIAQKTADKKPLQSQLAWGSKSSKEYAKKEITAIDAEIKEYKTNLQSIDKELTALNSKLHREFESRKNDNLEIKNTHKSETEFWAVVGYTQGVSLGLLIFLLLTCLHILEGSKINYTFNVKNVQSVEVGNTRANLQGKSGFNIPKLNMPSVANFTNNFVKKAPQTAAKVEEEELVFTAPIVNNSNDAQAKVVAKFEGINHKYKFIVADLCDYYSGKDGVGMSLVAYIKALCVRETMGVGEKTIEEIRNFFNNTLKRALEAQGLSPKYRS